MSAFLKYALNSNGELVHIDSVPNGNDCNCVCPACKKPLQAKNSGKIREHHFAHQADVDCPGAVETSLHLLAKEKIQKAFYAKEVFNIEFEYHSYCKNKKTCNFVKYDDCDILGRRKFNLKNYYDSCEQEIPYDDIKLRSDLKIWSASHPERKPIYIEFFVTHASDVEKLHSGSRIIEIKIDDENDIDNIVANGFQESARVMNSHRGILMVANTSFYGFKNEDYDNTDIKREIEFSRFILYQSGKFQCYQDSCLCKELKKIRKKSLCEICFHTVDALGNYILGMWIGYKKFGIKNCFLCKNYVDGYSSLGKLCRLYKYLGFNRFEPHDTSMAKNCKCFALNEHEMKECLSELNSNKSIPMTEF